MALSDDVQNRYSSSFLVALTNPDNPDASTINTTLLIRNADDIEAMFEIVAGVEFSDTNATHVAVGVEGVIALLKRRKGTDPDAERAWEEFLGNLGRLARIAGRNRVVPTSNSLLQPSADDRLTDTPRPAFDDRRFDAVLPAHPRGGISTDYTEE